MERGSLLAASGLFISDNERSEAFEVSQPRPSPGESQSYKFIDPSSSQRGGVGGLLETAMRRFKTLLHLVMILPLYAIGSGILGLSVAPGVFLVDLSSRASLDWSDWSRSWAIGSAIVGAIFLTGVMMIFILPITNRIFMLLLGGGLKPWRGPYYSLEAIRWYIHNGITYMLRYTLLELFTPSPLAHVFYKMMGMKIGAGAVINTTAISDPSLISIGEKVTLGGSVTIVAHYGQGGYLVLAPVEIGDGATIGLRASVMGGAKIGKGAKVLPHSVVMPKTVIPDGETWGGVPAHKMDLKAAVKPGHSKETT